QLLLARFDALNQQLIAVNALAGQQQAEALAQWISPPGNYAEQLRQLSADVRALTTDLQAEAQAQVSAMQDIQVGSRIALLVLSATGLLLALIVTVLVFRRTIQRITTVQTNHGRLAEGDLRLPTRWNS